MQQYGISGGTAKPYPLEELGEKLSEVLRGKPKKANIQ